MSRAQTTLGLPSARAAQLRDIADASGLTISELIEVFIGREIEASTIPDHLPGFEIEATEGQIVMAVQGVTLPPMSAEDAESLAMSLTATTKRKALLVMLDGGSIKVTHKGRGVILTVQNCGGTGDTAMSSLTRRMAADLARQLRNAIAYT